MDVGFFFAPLFLSLIVVTWTSSTPRSARRRFVSRAGGIDKVVFLSISVSVSVSLPPLDVLIAAVHFRWRALVLSHKGK